MAKSTRRSSIAVGGVALLKAEDNSPVGAHGDAPIPREIAFQCVEAETGQVKLFWSRGFNCHLSIKKIAPLSPRNHGVISGRSNVEKGSHRHNFSNRVGLVAVYLTVC